MNYARFLCSSIFLVALLASAGSAQVRTFVASTGVDTNPCSRTAPCRTFQAAVNAAAIGGEVVALDSAGFGSNVSITKPISIIASPGVYAGITPSSGDGIDINAGSSDTIVLRGLTVINQGSAGNGIAFNTGGVLHVESCIATGFIGSNRSATPAGLSINGHGNVEVKDSFFRGNAQGIDVQPSSGTAFVVIDQVRLEANSFNGFIALDGATVTIRNSVSSANTDMGFDADSSGSRPVEVNIENCVASHNSTGILTRSLSPTVAVTVRVSNSTITNNGTGLENDGPPAALLSRKNNSVEGNVSATFGTIGSFAAQ